MRRVLRNFRRGRAQRLLSAATAAGALPLGAEVYLNHYGGSFGNKWMASHASAPAPRRRCTGGIRTTTCWRAPSTGTSLELMVDANGAFTPAAAREWAHRYAGHGVRYLEEPVSSDDVEYFHDHVRLEGMLFDGVLAPADGRVISDPAAPGTA